ncbi:FAD-dependent oxidoreductase [Rheinheimera sp. 1928-s]|uniref:FAD-dependent oxidoreductase n=1 Tax=Rheinheimera sp. 1928-s TaxID=3033803 RepID=UPI0026093DF8|nr:FAD-dependent oxidoreductase [Rheinheimera sp. 1928-s]MDF3123731.1 FAD-dependent oxidoreductase [Rheinheimera sp. 1928-s]
MTHYHTLIVGAGYAGYSLAKELRKLDPERSICLISSDSADYYSKPLLSNGFSKQKSATDLVQKTAAQMATELTIDIRPYCQALQIHTESHQLLTDKGLIQYQQLVLATGASPVKLSLPAATQDLICSVNDLTDYQNFLQLSQGKQKITVLGAGLVGIEYANDLAAAGFQVSVIALEQHPLAQLLPPALGELLQQQLSASGVEFYWGSSIKDAQLTQQQLNLQLADGRSLETELILSAVGLKPNLQLALHAGIDCNKGIKVDQTLATSAADIYALGDCAEICGYNLMYIQPISLSARALASTLTGKSTAVQFPVMPVIVKSPALAVVSWPVAPQQQGEWFYEGQGMDWVAKFQSPSGQLLGFALTGKMVAQRLRLAKEMPALIA